MIIETIQQEDIMLVKNNVPDQETQKYTKELPIELNG